MIKYEVGDELRQAIERMVKQNPDIPQEKSISIVEMRAGDESSKPSAYNDTSMASENYGRLLEEILSRASTGETIVLVGSESKTMMADSPAWQGIMGYPNASYCESANLYSQLAECIGEASNQTRPKNDVAIDLAAVETPQSVIRALKHVVHRISGLPTEEMNKWRTQAKAIFGDLDDDKLIDEVEKAEPDTVRSLFEGKKLDVACFDIEGTLLQRGKVNQDLVAELNRVSQESPVIVWTDGDLKNAKALREAGVISPVRPKSIFAGASVSQAWDDKQEEDLKRDFDIDVETFHHVSGEGDIMREGLPGGPESR